MRNRTGVPGIGAPALALATKGLQRCRPRWHWLNWRFWCQWPWRRRRLWWKLSFIFGGTSARGCPSAADTQNGAHAPYAQYGACTTYTEDRTGTTNTQYRARASDAYDTAQ